MDGPVSTLLTHRAATDTIASMDPNTSDHEGFAAFIHAEIERIGPAGTARWISMHFLSGLTPERLASLSAWIKERFPVLAAFLGPPPPAE
jgi:hypothetical protein